MTEVTLRMQVTGQKATIQKQKNLQQAAKGPSRLDYQSYLMESSRTETEFFFCKVIKRAFVEEHSVQVEFSVDVG